jgi:hypothetical protein
MASIHLIDSGLIARWKDCEAVSIQFGTGKRAVRYWFVTRKLCNGGHYLVGITTSFQEADRMVGKAPSRQYKSFYS